MAHLKLNYCQLDQAVRFVKEKALPGQIQKIYSTSAYIIFRIRAKKQNLILYIGKGYGHECIWLHDKLPPPEARIYDSFVGLLRKHFANLYFEDIEVDEKDRIFKIKIRNNYKEYVFVYGYIGRYCYYYIEELSEGLIASNFISTTEFQPNLGFEAFEGHGRIELKKKSEKVFNNESLRSNFQKYLEGNYKKVQTKNAKKLSKKIKYANEDLSKLQAYTELFALAKKDDEFLEGLPDKMIVSKVKIKFKSPVCHHRRDYLFNRGKRLREVIELTQVRIRKLESDLTSLKNKFDFISPKKIVLAVHVRPKTESNSEQVPNPKNINQSNNISILHTEYGKIYFGLNSKGNDHIRRQEASKEDYWFHFENETGPHAILKLQSGKTIDPEVISLIGKKLVQIKGIEVDKMSIIYTQVKNLKSVKGKPGLVTYKKIKSFMVYL